MGGDASGMENGEFELSGSQDVTRGRVKPLEEPGLALSHPHSETSFVPFKIYKNVTTQALQEVTCVYRGTSLIRKCLPH